MNFNSWQFLIYLPIVVIVYYLIPHRFRWIWLLMASYFFYFCWSWIFAGLLFVTTIVSFFFSLGIEKYPKHRKLFLVLTLIICLGILGVFKYLQFALDNIIATLNLFGMTLSRIELNLILPVGISFYTFQTLSYVIDVYRGDYPAEHHFGYYALFVSFFPQLVAGPIEKPGDLIPQLKQNHKFNSDDFFSGLRFLLLGFFRKCCVADICGIFVDHIFSNLFEANSFTILVGGLLFCFQMYGDFAGYSEIAMGSSRLLGVKLTQNFDKPYTSLTYSEFFHRWHYTLNRWFTEYLYIPLGGNRKGKFRKVLNVILVFVLCGLWHGAKWTYVLWGLYAAFWITFETLFLKKILSFFEKHGIKTESSPFVFLRHVLIMFVFIFAAIFFRAENIQEIGIAMKGIVTSFATPSAMVQNLFSLSTLNVPYLFMIIVLLLVMDKGYDFAYQQPRTEFKDENDRFSYQSIRCLVYLLFFGCIALCWIGLINNDATSGFAYFQF